jgi:tetratricopeptide (TPR) repeat protein
MNQRRHRPGRSIFRSVITRFRTVETLALLVVSLAIIIGVGLKVRLGVGWIGALAVSFLLFAYIPLAVRLQDALLQSYLARGRFGSAMRIAAAVRDGARSGVPRSYAEFDVGLIHLARGANADAARSFRRVEGHRMQPRMRTIVAAYTALAELRASGDATLAKVALHLADEALAASNDDPYLLAAKGEALLAMGDAVQAHALISRSLELNGDPRDPSPGERHLLLGRTASRTGHRDVARHSFRIAAQLRVDGPFVRAARAELTELDANA